MSFAPEMKPVAQMRHGEMAQYGDDRGLIVRFFKQAVPNPFESEKQGKPVFEDRDFVTITSPGGKSDLTREVIKHQRDEVPPDTVRWARQWQQYVNEQVQTADGIPLDSWPPMGYAPAVIKGFKAAEIFTMEQLSALPDSTLQSIPVMDARKWRDLAIKYVEQAKGGAPIAALQQENTQLKEQMAVMQEQINALAANQKKTPGRKPSQHDEGDDD